MDRRSDLDMIHTEVTTAFKNDRAIRLSSQSLVWSSVIWRLKILIQSAPNQCEDTYWRAQWTTRWRSSERQNTAVQSVESSLLSPRSCFVPGRVNIMCNFITLDDELPSVGNHGLEQRNHF